MTWTWVADRRERLAHGLSEAGADALLVSNVANVAYLTGFSGDSSVLLLGRSQAVLVSDARYAEQIEEECPGLETHIRRTTGDRLADATAQVARSMGIAKLAYESSSITVSELADIQQALPAVEFVGWGGAVERLRARKDAYEVEQIRQAITWAEQAFATWRAGLRAGETEKEAADRMEMCLRRAGAQRGAFDAIVAVDARSALPHARSGDAAIADDSLILVDWGASRFYKSDLTRVLVGRRIPAKLEAVYEVVLRAQSRAIEKIRPGVVAKEVDAEARATIEESGFGDFFLHGTGHGLGLEVHEAPALRPNSETILEPGMVVTVEPGVYLRGWGGVRIEDDVLVTADGAEVLSTLAKDLDSICIR